MLSKINGSDELKWLYGLKTGFWASQNGEIFSRSGNDGADSVSSLNPSFSQKAFASNERMAGLQIFPAVNSDSVVSKKQRMFGLDQIDALSGMIDRQPDTFVSQSTFVGTTRRKCFFSRVRACWVDLDLHTQGMDLDAQTVAEIRLHCESLQLPQPTLIISSGRGAYLKWILQRAVTDLPAWEAAQSMLVLLFQNFCADKRARDACRVFRMLGTINSKVEDASRQLVQAIDGAGHEVPFELLATALEHARQSIDLPSQLTVGATGATKQRKPRSDVLNRLGERLLHAAERGSIDELKLYARLREPIMMGSKFSAASLGWARFCDLRDLYVQRGGIPVGERDTAMFWMMNCLGHAGIVTPANFQDEVLGLLHAFPQGPNPYEPLEDGSLQTLQQRLFKTHQLKESVKKGGADLSGHLVNAAELLYRPGNAFLIETFDITEQEQASLKTLIGPQEKLRRADAKAPGRAERRLQRLALKEQVKAWLEARGGVCDNVSALARELNEAVGRVWRTVQACLREMGLLKVASPEKPAHEVHARAQAVSCSKQQTAVVEAAAPAATSQWSVPAHLFVGFGRGNRGKNRKSAYSGGPSAPSPESNANKSPKPRSILGSYGARHASSLAALRLATARPKSAGLKHWMPAFVRDVADHYRRHAQWPSVEQRQALMAWHQQVYAANHPANRSARGPSSASGHPLGTMIPEKPSFSTEVTHNLSSKSKYLSTKDLFVQHYGEEARARWDCMTAVERLYASIEMEREIWSRAQVQAKQESQSSSLKDAVRERWQRMVGKDRERIAQARQKEEAQRHTLLNNAVGNLKNAWGRLSPRDPVAV